MWLVDILIVLTTGLVASGMRHQPAELPFDFWLVAGLGALLNANLSLASRVYEFSSLLSLRRQVAHVVGGWLLTVLLLVPIVLFAKTSIVDPSQWLSAWALSGGAAFVLSRVGLHEWLNRSIADGSMALRVVVTGTDSRATDVANRLRRSGNRDTTVEVVYPGDGFHETEEQCTDHLLEMTRLREVDEVVIHWPADPAPHLTTLVNKLGHVPIDVKLYMLTPEVSHIAWLDSPTSLPVWLIHTRPLAGWRSLLKRGVDLIFGAGLLVASLPLMLVIAAAIRLDSRGPVLFKQLRFGLNGEPILVFKFRTMHRDAGASRTVPQARRGDPRVTFVGRFLRRTSLDELPQLFNVCRGEMSLVGPRPHAVVHNELYETMIEAYPARHRVKPGITGWAQVNGARGETRDSQAMQKRIEYDLYYIQNWSLLLDLRILYLTLACMFNDPNAY
jgi:Undecaprenyl-phosphate glucose phosphotransferase